MSYTYGFVLTSKLIEQEFNTLDKLLKLFQDHDDYIDDEFLFDDEDAHMSTDISVLQMKGKYKEMWDEARSIRNMINYEKYLKTYKQ